MCETCKTTGHFMRKLIKKHVIWENGSRQHDIETVATKVQQQSNPDEHVVEQPANAAKLLAKKLEPPPHTYQALSGHYSILLSRRTMHPTHANGLPQGTSKNHGKT